MCGITTYLRFVLVCKSLELLITLYDLKYQQQTGRNLVKGYTPIEIRTRLLSNPSQTPTTEFKYFLFNVTVIRLTSDYKVSYYNNTKNAEVLKIVPDQLILSKASIKLSII